MNLLINPTYRVLIAHLERIKGAKCECNLQRHLAPVTCPNHFRHLYCGLCCVASDGGDNEFVFRRLWKVAQEKCIGNVSTLRVLINVATTSKRFFKSN